MAGKCYYCDKEVDKRGIKRHLSTCKTRKERIEVLSNKNLESHYMLEVCAKYRKSDYWIYIACHSKSKLSDLDKFLRKVWLECCGHLSEFVIGDTSYLSHVNGGFDMFGKKEETMNIMLKDVLNVDMKLKYSYDFGDTTNLEIKVLDEFMYSTKNQKIEIMARHNNLSYECENCGKKAKFYSYELGMLCDKCADEDDEYLMDLGDLSSPRSGVCGYCGSREDEKIYKPIKI